MLYSIDAQGNLAWHCLTPACRFHNCAAWEQEQRCATHPVRPNAPAGETIHAHISDEGVQWLSAREILLPACPGCGGHMTLRVHDEEETTPPVVTRDAATGAILQVAPAAHPKFSRNLWIVNKDVTRELTPHPTLAHLSPAEITQMQAELRAKAPEAPVDWMLTEVTRETIHAVYPHPAVARHRTLAAQLVAIGKTPPI